MAYLTLNFIFIFIIYKYIYITYFIKIAVIFDDNDCINVRNNLKYIFYI